MVPTRGLVIRQPWLDHIMEGRKRWEIRSRPSQVRGVIALIEAGAGVIRSLATLRTSYGPLTEVDWIHAKQAGHIVGPEASVLGYKSGYAWELGAILPLRQPVPYTHPRGAIIWVRLTEDVRRTLEIAVR